ncbi:RNA methyltransferase [Poritiphilus flavus]|uniref:RNA methyltransferase n=1 Tax=Poritiphilus flavus TaxID=2697053 RepID=A0A6L9EHC4_9FLAO|nr:RNA methyltransferase [Poritiphilus flavus]NAS14063.1 RNA methyltransferase [Poritiphilus flavus]
MVVKSQTKLIKNLQQKKYRNVHGLFVVEGIKTVNELLDSSFKAYKVFAINPELFGQKTDKLEKISAGELRKLSNLKTPNEVLGVFEIPPAKPLNFDQWIVALDTVQDPGNLGTIIRLCDWFGITQLLCSKETVDCYNPKVLQATMGSISRVNVVYEDLSEIFGDTHLPVYGTFMNGHSVYEEKWPEAGILLLGNEANGISSGLHSFIHKKIGIPQFGENTAESLNVATAAAIFMNEIKRVGVIQK